MCKMTQKIAVSNIYQCRELLWNYKKCWHYFIPDFMLVKSNHCRAFCDQNMSSSWTTGASTKLLSQVIDTHCTSFPTWFWPGHSSLWSWCGIARFVLGWNPTRMPKPSIQNQAEQKSPSGSSGWSQHPEIIVTVYEVCLSKRNSRRSSTKTVYLLCFVGHYISASRFNSSP